MNSDSAFDLASRFMGALKASPVLFARWSATSKSDSAAVAAIVQETLGLASAPTAAEMAAMAAAADTILQRGMNDKTAAPHAIGTYVGMSHDEVAPHAIGIFVGMSQAEIVETSAA